ncbi:MAG: LAGLIDADG family homing endonuclease [Candidatus Micrarchaeota archaeon]
MENIVEEEAFLGTYKYRTFGEKALNKYRHWFPVKSSADLSEIVASLLTDGHLEGRKVQDHFKYDYFGYFSKNTEDLEHFNGLLKRCFGIQGKIRSWGKRLNGASTGVIVCNYALSRILFLCGAERGDKITKEYRLPAWISNGSLDTRAAFLRRAFSCEGTITRDNRGYWALKYTMGKTEAISQNGITFLTDMKKMLYEFGIESNNIFLNQKILRKKDNTTTYMYCLKILRKSIPVFADKIGFDIGYKNDRLQKARAWASTSRVSPN